MVTIINAVQRTTREGKTFIAFQLQGDVEMVQSQTTGNFFLTAKKCYIPSTFTKEEATSFIGKQLRGTIERVECPVYEYTVPSTGEVITLAHTYSYQPEVLVHKQTVYSPNQV
ncbi:hypothetical protein [Chitinophaga niabensis]|uniref:Uncharacterized protein n=1 Tax=Chitinophaga niabensis TaxID=536979 RepID=A0A1N6ERI4_9BACT|nr:hypothetical protein [Chitinophaga niabensis]SIN85625.1 hypothetical protein SAMN04488055_1781 [Chitinophaga niabensis]